MPPTKAPNSIDLHVGSRVRLRRVMLCMSQEKLGGALGITFQQVQKYEKGMNRISASRLQHSAQILQVPATFFFEDTSDMPSEPAKNATAGLDPIMTFTATSEGLALARAFMRLTNKQVRRRIVDLVEEIVGGRLSTEGVGAMIDDGGKRHRQQLEEMGKPFKDFRAELERQHPDLRGRSAAEISAKLKREKKAAKARDRGSRRGPNQR
jgi:transcriptional regulator with XRE-family HTH domain